MEEYLTSSETLEKLCEIQPDHPIKYGIGKVSAGLGLAGIAAGCGWGGWILRDMVTNAYNNFERGLNFELGLGILIEGLLACGAIASGGFGLKFLADGLTSLAKPFGMYSPDGYMYYRNGGFINKPSGSDKKFGTKVNPVENVEDFQLDLEGYILVNGLFIQDVNVRSQTKTRFTYVYNAATKTSTPVPIPYTEYTVTLDGELKDKPLRVFTVTESGSFVDSLTDEKGSAIYVMGTLDEDEDIDLEQYGDAFKR